MAARQHPSPWTVAGWIITALGLIVGVLGLLVPDVRSWLADNGITAWIITMAVVVAAPAVCALAIRQRFKQASLRSDIALVWDCLDGWTLDCPFYRHLSDGINWKAFPSEYHAGILTHLYRWERDKRVIEDPSLAAAFHEVQAAVRELEEQIGTFLWLDDSADRLSIPREWDGRRKKEAYDGLSPAADRLEKALGDLFALLHRLDVRAQA